MEDPRGAREGEFQVPIGEYIRGYWEGRKAFVDDLALVRSLP
jgi:hypothetical protein